jgi:hypothetical protein
MPPKVFIKNDEIKELIGIQTFDFPKYSTQIINLANQNAQGTRPKVVGQMSELIQEFSGKSIQEWETWYLNKYPQAIDDATKKISAMVNNLKIAMGQIDDELIKDWVHDLVIIKTFIGLKFQESILKKISQLLNKDYRLSTPGEEAIGIDGFVGDVAISIKPDSYKVKNALNEKIDVKIVYYSKDKRGLKINIDEIIN